MIYSQLMLARNLLSDDGVIFISIDDGEAENLRKICDEASGGTSFAADLIWQKEFSRSTDTTYFLRCTTTSFAIVKRTYYIDQDGWRIGLLPRGERFPQVIAIQIMPLVRCGLRLFCRLNLAPVVYYIKYSKRSAGVPCVGRETILQWIAKRKMPAYKVGRLWKFKLSEVDDWIRSGGAAEDSSYKTTVSSEE